MKEFTVLVFFTFKFALTFPVAVYGLQMSFWETMAYSNLGGLIGLLVSVYLSKLIIYLWDKYVVSLIFRRTKENKSPVFTRRKRFIVKVKTRYGLPGIVILTYVFLSIPVGAFLMTKYYGARIRNVFWLLIGQVSWSLIYTIFYLYIKEALHI